MNIYKIKKNQNRINTKTGIDNTVSTKSNIVLNIIFLFYTFICVFPLCLLFSMSITEEKTLLSEGAEVIPQKISFLAYEFLFNDFMKVARAYGVTITVTLIGTLFCVFITAAYAYPLSRRDFPYKRIFSVFVLITMVFSGGMPPFYLIYTRVLDIDNTLFALILPFLFNGFYMFVIRTFFIKNVHPAIIDSARIDGAGELRIFFKIVLPISKPVLATVALFTTILYWNDWFNALLFITDQNLYPIQFLMQKAMLQQNIIRQFAFRANAELIRFDVPGEGIRMAMAIVGMGPIVIAYPFFQKYFIKGLTIGSIKG